MKKKRDEFFIPAWIMLTNGRIIEGFISTNYSKAEFKMIIPDEYKINPDEILSVRNALIEIGLPLGMSLN